MALLVETNPELINEWHWEKNKDIDIRTVSRGSHKKAWWKCSMGHEWEAVIGNRARLGVGCAVCNGKKAQKGFNDLGTLLPESLEWWDYDKNFPLTPYDVTSQSNKKAWWRCSCGHSWQAVIATFKRGDRCPYCSGHKVLTGFNDLATTHPHLLEEWDYKKNTMRPAELSAGSITQVWWLCPQGHSHLAAVCDKTRTDRRHIDCPQCSKQVSSGEKELYDFFCSIFPKENIVSNDRMVIKPHELDIYLPHKNIAIEYNGIYWHSDKVKPVDFHAMKYRACAEKGVQLITVWEDDWLHKRSIVESMLRSKVGADNRPQIYARNTIVVDVVSSKAREFCDQYHIQGAARCSHYIGLDYQGNLVAVMGVHKVKDVAYIDRYATSCHVIGGLGKCVAHIQQWCRNNGCVSLVTFSDNDTSDGHSYKMVGFHRDKDIPPDYKYVYNGRRCHKFNFRLKRFRVDSALEWQEGLSERELADLNGIYRTWDAGKIRWVLAVPQLAQEGMAQ